MLFNVFVFVGIGMSEYVLLDWLGGVFVGFVF